MKKFFTYSGEWAISGTLEVSCNFSLLAVVPDHVDLFPIAGIDVPPEQGHRQSQFAGLAGRNAGSDQLTVAGLQIIGINYKDIDQCFV